MTCRCAACHRTPLRVIAALSAVGGLPRHLRTTTKIRLLLLLLVATSHRVCIRLGKRLNPPQHALPLRKMSPMRLPAGWPSARHACLAPVTPTAYRAVLPCSRSVSCNACAPGRSQPCDSSQSPFVGRSVGGPRDAPTAGKATRPHPPRHPSRRISLGSRRSSARCARTAPDRPSAWFPRVTTPN